MYGRRQNIHHSNMGINAAAATFLKPKAIASSVQYPTSVVPLCISVCQILRLFVLSDTMMTLSELLHIRDGVSEWVCVCVYVCWDFV